jgi:hypothetical protein
MVDAGYRRNEAGFNDSPTLDDPKHKWWNAFRVRRSRLPEAYEHKCTDRLLGRVVHLHIPKTAGSALAAAFAEAFKNRLQIYPERFESRYSQADYHDNNFYTGHIGFKVASEIGGDFITVLRDPVDRFLSTYYFLRQLYNSGAELTHKASLTARYDLDQFVRIRDEPILHQELLNRMTWQIAYSHRLELRKDLIDAGVDGGELVRVAIANLRTFAIVGVQSDMASLAESIRQRYDVTLSIGRTNVTHSRLARADVSAQTLEHIEWWVQLDQELYRTWMSMRSSLNGSPEGGTGA